jgi:hypothetical protein
MSKLSRKRFEGFTVITLVGCFHLRLQWTILVFAAILSAGHAC